VRFLAPRLPFSKPDNASAAARLTAGADPSPRDPAAARRRKRLAAAIESLESRTLLSVSISQQIAPVSLPVGTGTTLNLAQDFTDPQTTGTFVEFQTSLGDIEVQLFNQSTPLTVANFLQYVNGGLYNNTIIHRSVSDFIVQGGGYTTTGAPITTFAPVQNEPGISNTLGTIAMAKVSGEPDSATSQFFFNTANNSQVLDNENGGFTVFGDIVQGLNVVEQINNLTTVSTTLGPTSFQNLPLLSATGGTSPSNLVQVTSVATVAAPQLTITAVSDDTKLLTTTVTGENLALNAVAGQSGYAHVTITATGPSGTSVTQVVRVHVVGGQTLDVPLGNGHPRSVSYRDSSGNAATLTFSGPGSAVAAFSGTGLSLGGGTVRGKDVGLDSFTANGTTAASSLAITGPASRTKTVGVGDLTFNGSAGTVRLQHATLDGDLAVSGSVRNLVIDVAEDGSISVGSGSALNVDAGIFVNEALTSLAPIIDLKGAEWINPTDGAGITAPSIKMLKVDSDFTPGLTLNGSGSQLLGSIRVGGFIGGTWTVPGKLPNLRVGGTAEDFDATFTNPISVLSLPLGFDGDLSVPSIGELKAGSMTDADLTLTGAFAAGRKDLGRLKIAGEIDNSVVESTGNIGAVSARGIDVSALYAGVTSLESGGNLPNVSTDFSSHASIASVQTRGVQKSLGFSASDIAAWTLGNLQLGKTTVNNDGSSFGVAADSIAGLSAFDVSKKQTFSFGHLSSATALAKLIAARKLTLSDLQIILI
jgi:cyclophilin family peptidyl-prolyl cis-trans isomerase